MKEAAPMAAQAAERLDDHRLRNQAEEMEQLANALDETKNTGAGAIAPTAAPSSSPAAPRLAGRELERRKVVRQVHDNAMVNFQAHKH